MTRPVVDAPVAARVAVLAASGLGVVTALSLVAVLAVPSGPVFALVANLLVTLWVGAAVDAYSPAFGSRWFTVRTWEPALWRRLGVGVFGTALRVIGWERMVTRRRGFDATRSGLRSLDRHTRSSELCHLLVGSAGTVAVVVALLCRDVPAAVWFGGAVVVFHLYPVLLQRILRARISRVVDGNEW
ncbi:hypothetical protein EV383_4317 [Pseudonocardia sediminis]|uniref:Glycosyl-4,4'-diaponeurosporenoate acyltransferase n=1 Tax=Pseudonocardia sediminis TaxID=1397368 RepID=A0A4Q7UZH7_PSEST|nr:hypothetical protein [Pseudonocardia sediminis]RZT87396.1 hypothetical protein EV383_4317 [Pseudonocardia sediminis]